MSFHSIAKKPLRQLRSGVFEVWKERGETLAVLVRRFRSESEIDEKVPITYAGRLDPMAEGLVLLLVGEARFEKEKYLSLSKTYQCTILFGISTDSYDVLGVISEMLFLDIKEKEIETAFKKVLARPLPYPPFSSKPVEGIPLFVRARGGALPKEFPLQSGTAKRITLLRTEKILFAEVAEIIIKDIKKVEGEFRQEKIIQNWKEVQGKYRDVEITLATCEIAVPSGVYIRSIAHEVGNILGMPSLAHSIVRTSIE